MSFKQNDIILIPKKIGPFILTKGGSSWDAVYKCHHISAYQIHLIDYKLNNPFDLCIVTEDVHGFRVDLEYRECSPSKLKNKKYIDEVLFLINKDILLNE